MKSVTKGITIAEIIITFAVMGIISAFFIPKLMVTGGQQGVNYTKGANQFAQALASAYQAYVMQNGPVTASAPLTTADGFMQYLNYTKRDTSGTTTIDGVPGTGSLTCDSNDPCYFLQNGAVVRVNNTMQFCDTTHNSFLYFGYDPDGVYGGSTQGISKLLIYDLHADGKIVPSYQRTGNICNSGSTTPLGWGADPQPSWYTGMY